MTDTIEEFAEKYDADEETIRYYTELEILPYSKGEEDDLLFDQESCEWMEGIQSLLAIGASLDDIQEFSSFSTPQYLRALIEAKYKR